MTAAQLSQLSYVTGLGPDLLSVRVSDDDVLPAAVAGLHAAGIAVTELSLHLPTLDEVFFTLTGRTDTTESETAA